jgi:hypothetical protein
MRAAGIDTPILMLRRYTDQMPPEQIGWLAGARDPIVGGALALMHRSQTSLDYCRTGR